MASPAFRQPPTPYPLSYRILGQTLAARPAARWLTLGWVLAILTAAVTACSGAGQADSGAGAGDGTPQRGGTLKLIGNFDVDHLATTSAYSTWANTLLNTFARQIVSYDPVPDWNTHIKIAADLAREVPTRENGGISADGKTYTFHLRRGVRWNTQPPRELVAGDQVRALEMLCNPVNPNGAPGYFTATISGMKSFCDAFAKADPTVAGIKRFVDTHDISGVKASDDTTLVIALLQPTPDFLNILAMPFSSAMPVEYLEYLPDGPEAREHTISAGPYQITKYVAEREYTLGRNPSWNAETDPLRKAWVDSIQIVLGINAESVQQQLQAGTADISWDQQVPTADLALLIAGKDPNLVLGPPGDHWSVNSYLTVNMVSPNQNAALSKLKVRQALDYAIDRTAIAQVFGGPAVARPLRQAVVSDAAGYKAGYDPFPSPGDKGDPARAKQLLTEAGYPNGVTLKLLHRTSWVHPQIAQTVQASLAKAGFTIELVPSTQSDFYSKYLRSPDNTKRGVWDIAAAGWVPDWFGNNGRSVVEPLFDGRTIGVNSVNYGAYSNTQVDKLIDDALSAPSEDAAITAWQAAAQHIMEDGAIVPLVESKQTIYHSARVRNCVFHSTSFNCDLTALWLQGGGAGASR